MQPQTRSVSVKPSRMSLSENSVYEGATTDDNLTLNESQNVPDMDEGLEEFKMDHTVPPGWSYSPGWRRNNQKFRCPRGQVYRSRATAFEKMILTKEYSIQDIIISKSTDAQG